MKTFKKEYISRFLDYKGRSSSYDYLVSSFQAVAVGILAMFLSLGFMDSENYMVSDIGYVLYIATLIFMTIFTIPFHMSSIRRFHDLGKSGWWILLLFVPIIGFFVYIYLLFKSGETEENKYGHSYI